jgi:hypothetical protein
MTILTREQILEAQDIEVREIDVPEWGGIVKIRALTLREREEYDSWLFSTNKLDSTTSRARLLSMAIVGDDGNPIFTEGDIKALAKKNSKICVRLSYIVQKLSGMTPGAIQEMTEDFLADQRSGSNSASP